MKKTFLTLSFFVPFLMVSIPAHAYKFVIYTDEAVTTKSEQVAEIMKTTYPFNKFDIEVEIVRLPAAELACASVSGVDRLVTCENLDNIQARAARLGGDQAMIVKEMPNWGGSSAIGGGVPVITTGTSPRVMLHEYMHTLGLCDEYEYVESEAAFYCEKEADRANLTFITPLSFYSGDTHARSEHSSKIPWFKDILSTTPITNSGGTRLGTGMVNFNKVEPINNTSDAQILVEQTGLYQGKVCNKANPPRASWQPGGGATIMENTEAGLGAPLERIVEKMMASKGARKKMQLEEPKESQRFDGDAGEITVNPEKEVEINNTGRSFFKSILDWLKDLFQTISNGFPR